MTKTNETYLAVGMAHRWHDFWRGEFGEWIITRGLRLVMLLIAAILAVRFVTWVADQVTRQLDERFVESDALVRSEATKHRQAVASVIQWVSIVMIAIWAIVQIADVLQFSMKGLGGAGHGASARRWVSALSNWSRICCQGSSSSSKSSTVSVTWSSLTVAGIDDRSAWHCRERDFAGDPAALAGWRTVNDSQRPDRQSSQPVQGLGARGSGRSRSRSTQTSAGSTRCCARSAGARWTTRCWVNCCWTPPQ